jgi:hypothetical protein
VELPLDAPHLPELVVEEVPDIHVETDQDGRLVGLKRRSHRCELHRPERIIDAGVNDARLSEKGCEIRLPLSRCGRPEPPNPGPRIYGGVK